MTVHDTLLSLLSKLKTIKNTPFIRSVALLVGGTAFAQAITLLALPLLTRLYSPLDYSILAAFASTLSIISVVTCLRLEIAIPMPEREEDAANLLALALCACLAFTTSIGIAIWLFPSKISALLGQPLLSAYLWMMPLGIWLSGTYTALQFWATRKKRFSTIAKTRMTQAVGGTGAQVAMGLIGLAPFGLLFGQVITSGTGLFGISRESFNKDRSAFKAITWTGMKRVLRVYDRFPKYSTFEAFANSASVQLPIIIIAASTEAPEAGYLMLAMRVMAAPISLIGGAISQVYWSRAPKELRAKRLADFTLKIISGLAKSGIGVLIFFGISAHVVFPIIFGNNWQRAGEIVTWMTPWFVMQLLTSPISMTLHLTGNQRTALALQLFGLVLRVGFVGAAANLMPSKVVEVYAVSGFVFYCIYFHVIIVFSGIKWRQMLIALKPSLLISMFWIIGGLLLVLGLSRILKP